jgi:transposase
MVMVSQIEDTQTRIAGLEKQILAWHKNNPVSQRLATVPGIGPIIATAIAATVADPKTFRSGREFAARLGLVPRQSSTGKRVTAGLANEVTVISAACSLTVLTPCCSVRNKPRPTLG